MINHKSWILCKFAPDFKKIRRYYAKESGNSGVTRQGKTIESSSEKIIRLCRAMVISAI